GVAQLLRTGGLGADEVALDDGSLAGARVRGDVDPIPGVRGNDVARSRSRPADGIAGCGPRHQDAGPVDVAEGGASLVIGPGMVAFHQVVIAAATHTGCAFDAIAGYAVTRR